MAIATQAIVVAMLGPQAPAKIPYIAPFLSMADRIIKNYCKRDLEQTAYTEYYSGQRSDYLVLRQRPVLVATDVTGVWVDMTGFWGQGTNAFSSATALTQGADYAVKLDTSGMLYRITTPFMNYGQGSTLWGGIGSPKWPLGDGNIKVTYTAGYATIPEDLAAAAAMLVVWMMRNTPLGSNGLALTSESFGAYSYSLSYAEIPELGTIRSILARYRDVAL